jgi:hypothetical protein
MSLLVAIAVGIALGFALGGRFGQLAEIRLRWNALLFVALALQIILFGPLNPLPARSAPALYLLSDAIASIWVVRNLTLAGIPCIGLGALSNLVAIAANGGRMPVDFNALVQTRGQAFARAVAQHTVPTNAVIADAHTRLWWLTDRFVLPRPLPSPVFSCGDVLIGVGVVWLIVAAMRSATDFDRRL